MTNHHASSTDDWAWVLQQSQTPETDAQENYLWDRGSGDEDMISEDSSIDTSTSMRGYAAVFNESQEGEHGTSCVPNPVEDEQCQEALPCDLVMDIEPTESPQTRLPVQVASAAYGASLDPSVSRPAATVDQVIQLSMRYESLRDDLYRERSKLDHLRSRLSHSPEDFELQHTVCSSERIITSKRAMMSDVEDRIISKCRVLQLTAEDFVSFENDG